MKRVVVISGPTATGKTATSLDLARSFGGEVVNFDSLLLYREINIGTAKPSLEERQLVPHHLIDVRSISDPMNAADYAAEALPVIEELLAQEKTVYLVGGSGFYLQALLFGMYNSQSTPEEITLRSQTLYDSSGIKPFIQVLSEHDPQSLLRYHPNDHYRIRRAVEHFWTTGRGFSEARAAKDFDRATARQSNVHGWHTLHIHLDLPKDEHQEIIRRRTEAMLRGGLLQELDELLSRGFLGNEKPLQCIGYLEALEYRRGTIGSEQECLERIVISTRQLAKSQRTWFKRNGEKFVYHPLAQKSEITERVGNFLKI